MSENPVVKTTLAPLNPYEGLDKAKITDKIVDAKADPTGPSWSPVSGDHTGGASTQYVSEVLGVDKATKPKLNHDKVEGDLDKIATLVWSKLDSKTLTVTQATAFLWAAAIQFTHKIPGDWKSYQIVIQGDKGGAIVGVQDLLESVPSQNVALNVDGATADTKEAIPFLVGCCLAPYRFSTGMKTEYFTNLNTRVWSQLHGLAPEGLMKDKNFQLTTWTEKTLDWNQDRNYSVICAAYDMFWTKCKDHPYAKLRVCTIRARFLDCAAFMGWQYLRKNTALSFNALATWIWDPQIAADFRRLFKSGEELDKEDSYLPYLASMKISAKSPYSASANPYLHMFIHSFGCLKHTTRSINSKMVGEINVDIPLRNAVFMWLALAKPGHWDREFTFEGDKAQEYAFALPTPTGEEKKKKKITLIPPPPKPEARYWHRFLQANGNDLPQYMWDHAAKSLAGLLTPRTGTIGEHARKWGQFQAIAMIQPN